MEKSGSESDSSSEEEYIKAEDLPGISRNLVFIWNFIYKK